MRLHGKGDQVRIVPLPARARERVTAWLQRREPTPGPLWVGQRGRLTVSGITQVVLAAGADAADRAAYAALKRQLAARDWPSMDAYADAKGPLIGEILARAGA